jgi:hypothetical protein
VPRTFNVWGTLVYATSSATAFTCLILSYWWTPPWYVLLPMYFYVFMSAGIIALGRLESNRDAVVFAHLLRKPSEENKRGMN